MAGGVKLSGEDEIMSDINITPFVDVVLVLLVIFMATAGIMVNRGLKIELPEAATAEQLQSQITLAVVVGRDGTISLDGQVVSLEELKERALKTREGSSKVVVMISADKGSIYKNIIEVMDAFRKAGVSEFALQLESVQ
jgi:biopolymer transport protein ExbD